MFIYQAGETRFEYKDYVSKPFPYLFNEKAQVSGMLLSLELRPDTLFVNEAVGFGLTFTTIQLRDVNQIYQMPKEDAMGFGIVFTSFVMRDVLKTYTAPAEDKMSFGITFTTFDLKDVLKTYTMPAEDKMSFGITFTSLTLT